MTKSVLSFIKILLHFHYSDLNFERWSSFYNARNTWIWDKETDKKWHVYAKLDSIETETKKRTEEHGERDLNENFSTTWNTLNEQIRR